jgi:signal transduction histidine kinase/CheY-like chemotaxis protein
VIVFHKLVPLVVLMLDLLLLGSALATQGRNERNRRFAYLSLALAVWAAGVLGLRWTDDPDTALVWEWVLHVGVVLIPIFFYQYVWVLLGDRRRRVSLTVGYVLAAAFVFATVTPAFMTGVRQTRWGFAPEPGPLYPAFVAYFLVYMFLGLAVLLVAHRHVQSTFRKNRLRLVIVGVAVSLLGGLVDFGRFLLDLEWVYPPAIPASAVFVVALGVAIVRYRLMSVSVLAKRVLLYAVTWAAMTPATLVAFGLVDEVLPRIPGLGAEVPTATFKVIAVLTLLMLALPVMRRLESLLDRLMFRRERAAAEALVALDRELLGLQDVPTLARRLTAGLATRIPVVHASLYVPAPEGEGVLPLATASADDTADSVPIGLPAGVMLWMRVTRRTLAVDTIGNDVAAAGPGAALIDELERAHVALVLPVVLESELTALLVVGEKLSGEVFEPTEIEFLEILAGRIATALRNARLYQDLTAQMKELRTARSLYGQARQADRAKEEFLAMLAHELRNPLAPIVNAAQVLQSIAGDDAKAAAMIAMIRRQAHRLARLVDDLLDISRIQLGKIRLNTEVLDLRDLVRQVLETLRTSGKGHGREIRAEFADEPLAVRGDAVRLEQVFWNLLDNALKYSPPESPVTVSVAREGGEALVRIQDQGIGIAPEVLPRIFELFTQADASVHRSQGGLGLGLALVRSLVEQHQGSVTAISGGPGQGSEFVVRLSLVRAGVVGAAPEAASPAGAAARRVMVVDAAADSRESLRMLLEMYGTHVQCAEDGATALAVAEQWAPDITIIDIGLPDMDGYELARRLRSTSSGRAMFVVALTGYDQPGDRRRALDSGCDAHFVKPIGGEELRRIAAATRRVVDHYAREADG